MTTPSFSREERRFRVDQAYLIKYQMLLEETLGKLLASLPESMNIQSFFGDLPIQVRSAFSEAYLQQRQYEVKEVFPTIARYSLVVMVFAILEDQAHVFCDSLEQLRSLPLKWGDLKGNALDRLHSYAVRLAGLPAPSLELWQAARSLQQIRDCIVHANGEVARSQDAKHLRQVAGKLPGYSLGENGRIVLAEQGSMYAIQVLSALFDHLFDHAGFPLTG